MMTDAERQDWANTVAHRCQTQRLALFNTGGQVPYDAITDWQGPWLRELCAFASNRDMTIPWQYTERTV